MELTIREGVFDELPEELPATCALWLEDPDADLEPLVGWLDAHPQPAVKSLTFGQARFDPMKHEFPEEPVVDRETSHRFFAAFPNLERLEVVGWALFDTISHPSVEVLHFVGTPAWDPGVWTGSDPSGMHFPRLKKLVWKDAEDSHGLSCFEGDGLAWALDARQTPELIDIEATDAISTQLCSESLADSLLTKTFERIRISFCDEHEILVRVKTLEVLDLFEDVDYPALANRYGMTIAHVRDDGDLVVVASPG